MIRARKLFKESRHDIDVWYNEAGQSHYKSIFAGGCDEESSTSEDSDEVGQSRQHVTARVEKPMCLAQGAVYRKLGLYCPEWE